MAEERTKVKMTEKAIRDSLMEQAMIKKLVTASEEGGMIVRPDVADIIEQYIFLYKQIREMKKCIREKGREYEAVSAAGKQYLKENPAVKDLIIYNKQILAIRKQLGLDVEGAELEEDDEL
jgi:P27 family predicted phage terminase small subunit